MPSKSLEKSIDYASPARQKAYWNAVVINHLDLTAEWQGWKLRGRCLVSPDGDRITPQRLRGILFTEACRQQLASRRRRRTAALITLMS